MSTYYLQATSQVPAFFKLNQSAQAFCLIWAGRSAPMMQVLSFFASTSPVQIHLSSAYCRLIVHVQLRGPCHSIPV